MKSDIFAINLKMKLVKSKIADFDSPVSELMLFRWSTIKKALEKVIYAAHM